MIRASLLKQSLILFAETKRSFSLGRAVVALILGLVSLNKLPVPEVALWLTAVTICALWQMRAATGLLGAAVETDALKLNLLMAFGFNTLAWSSFGDLLWGIGSHEFQGICMVLWMTQLMLAGLVAFRSRSAYVVGTIAPITAMMCAVIPAMAHLDIAKSSEVIGLCMGPIFAYGVSRKAEKQRQILDRTVKQLEQLAEDAVRAASAKSEFLANMSHELRTPLTAILGFSELLQNSKSLGSDDARAADRINTASRTLLTVVNDVLDFSKMEAGALELEAEAMDPVRLMQDALDVVGAAAAAKGLDLRLEVTGAPIAVVADPVRLSQVLFNLVNNALKFTSRGGIVGAVAFAPLDETTCRVRFEVRDTGIGIPDDKRALMFQRFSQADGSITRQFGGTGLGLAICKRIVSLMDGVIDVDSQPGKGSVFWLEVDLPVADNLVAKPSAHAIEDWAGVEVRALVAEDHPVNQELLRVILETVGVTVQIVGDGAQAVDAYQRGAFDIIVMDVQMPVMDGPEATRRIRALEGDGPRVPIIALTANVMTDQISSYFAAGMDVHLGKPIDSHALITTVFESIARSEARPAAAIARAA